MKWVYCSLSVIVRFFWDEQAALVPPGVWVQTNMPLTLSVCNTSAPKLKIGTSREETKIIA